MNFPNFEVGNVPNLEDGNVPNFEVGNVPNFEVGNVPNLKFGNCIQSIITLPELTLIVYIGRSQKVFEPKPSPKASCEGPKTAKKAPYVAK